MKEFIKECVGVDNLRHGYFGNETTALCGMKIKRKKNYPEDWKLFCCCECDYRKDSVSTDEEE